MTEPTEALRLGRLEPDKADNCVALSAEAGWNQTDADWRLMLRLGAGVGFFIGDGTLVATAIALPFGDRFAWIGMVLVSTPYRHRGLATRLMENRLTYCKSMGLPAVLDATDAQVHGQPFLGLLWVERFVRRLRREIAEVVPTGTSPLRHGVGVAGRRSATARAHRLSKVRHLAERPIA